MWCWQFFKYRKSSIHHPGMAMSRVRWKGHGQKKGEKTGKKKRKKGDQRYVESEGKGRFYRLSTRRFIPEGNDVSRVLIHLPSLIFHRHGSRLGGRSITMIATSDSECAPLLKCSSTGDTSVLRCTMWNRWPLTLAWSGWPVSPTYWRPHLLHEIK